MRYSKGLIAAIGATALLAANLGPVGAQDSEAPDLQARVDEFVGLLPGGVAAITIKDGVTTTAAAGIADVDGTPIGVETPVLISGGGGPWLHVLVLQLAEAGLVDLDEPVTTYLPDAPVADGATVRDVLTSRAGVPLLRGDELAAVRANPEHIFTANELVDGMDQQAIGPLGRLLSSYGNALIVVQLIEAATGSDVATVLAEQVAGPLGMTATRRPDGDPEAVGDVAGGWIAPGGEPVYLPNTSNASRTYRPMVTSTADVATYLSALVAGELILPELLESTVLDESLEAYAYDTNRPDEMSTLTVLGPSSTRWFGTPGFGTHTGSNSIAAISPDTGDIVVVITNNLDLDPNALARDIVADWDAAAPITTGAAIPAQGTLWYSPLFLCDWGQPSGFDLTPCAADDEGIHLAFDSPFELSGTLDGIGSLSGIQTVGPDDTHRSDAKAIFVGEVEGCGIGTVHFLLTDVGGFFDGTTVVWTQNTWEVVPGGTLPVSGSFEGLGPEIQLNEYSSSFDFTGELMCAEDGVSADT